MDSDKTYEESRAELIKIDKQLGSDHSIAIDFTKFDSVTKGEMLSAIQSVVSKRKHEIEKVILGVK